MALPYLRSVKLYFRLAAESFAFAFQSLRANVLRTFLSLLGVTIGIFAIIIVLTLVDSMKKGLKDTFSMLGDDTIFVQKWPWAPEDGKEYEWWRYWQRKQPTMRQADELRDRLSTASAVAFSAQTSASAERGNSNIPSVGIIGVSYSYPEVVKVTIGNGRYFTEPEVSGGRNLAIIGHDVSLALFGLENPIGQEIKINGSKLNVIGVFKREGQSIVGNGFDRAIMVPAQFGTRVMNYEEVECNIVVKAKEGVSTKELKDDIIANFRAIRKVKPEAKPDFAINETSMISATIDSIFSVVKIVGFIIGILAGIVGCVNIANIMFVSVKERTGIIGIQKALGAKRAFILYQFLFESIGLCLVGGLIGLLLVYLMTLAARSFDFPLVMSLGNFITGIVLAVISGVLAGFIPARNASLLNPVDAIRANS
jgi:putative ABC transport system permease protein